TAAHDKGIRTIINLRTADENGVLTDEERLVENSGLSYAAIPISPETIDDAAVAQFSQILASVDALPAIVHCQGGGRAGVLTLLHLAIENGWSFEETLAKGAEMGNIAPAENSPYRAFFERYINQHSAGER
ncbi:MAG TPA: sulfur transferase domain-containing protein, partial [Abditibacteriaceae bacterium]